MTTKMMQKIEIGVFLIADLFLGSKKIEQDLILQGVIIAVMHYHQRSLTHSKEKALVMESLQKIMEKREISITMIETFQ